VHFWSARDRINAQVSLAKVLSQTSALSKILEEQISKIRRDEEIESDDIRQSAVNKIPKLLDGATNHSKLLSADGRKEELLKKGEKLAKDSLNGIPVCPLGLHSCEGRPNKKSPRS